MRQKINILLGVLLIGALLLMISPSFAKGPTEVGQVTFYKASALDPTRTLSNINNWAYWMYYDGTSGIDPDGSGGGIYPRGTSNVIYEDGVVWGAIVDGKIKVGGQTYRTGTQALLTRIYRIRTDWRTLTPDQVRQDAAEFFRKNVGSVTNDEIAQIIEQYEKDWREWPWDKGAPWVDVDGDGTYNPDVDEAGLANADQVVWFKVNDLDSSRTTKMYGSGPIGIELQVTAWGYNQPQSQLGQIIFKKYKIINISGKRLDSMYVAQWSDPDVGNYTDDVVGNDPALSLGFAYNGSETDNDFAAFDLAPAAVGYDFFQGPIVPSPGDTAVFDLKKRPGFKNLPMTSFGYFSAGNEEWSDPELGTYDGTLEWYNLLRGFITNNNVENPTPFTHRATGEPTKFPLDGDPVTGQGDIDGLGANFPPADRRMSLSTGPFVMQPGDTQEVVVAIVGGIGKSRLGSVFQLKNNDEIAQILYDNLFQAVPKPPAPPKVVVTTEETELVLNWDVDKDAVKATEEISEAGYVFEGYNVYQLPSPKASLEEAVRIATFDKINDVTRIYETRLLEQYGQGVVVPVQFGTNSGIQRYFVVKKNYITGEPLYPGNTYYFAVTAYNYNRESEVVKTLESPLTVIPVTTQAPKPGDALNSNPEDEISVTKTGISTGNAEVKIVDPASITGHDYKVTFSNETQYTVDANGDTIGAWYKWNLVDVTTGQTVLADQSNLEGGTDYPIVDGLMVKVMGPKINGLAGWDYDGPRWVTGVNFGGSQFFGGLDLAMNVFGSALGLSDLVPIELVFQSDTTSGPEDGWASKGAVFRRDLGYSFDGIGYLPFAAYDISDPNNPRQVNVCFVESGDIVPSNHRWDMGYLANGGSYPDEIGAREYLFIMKSDYDGGASYNDNNDFTTDALYFIWPAQRGTRDYMSGAFTMDIFVNIPNGPNDVYTFSTKGLEPKKNDIDLAREAAEKVTVYPNPYYAFNPQEPDRFSKFVTFYHLPKIATIRIFDLAGSLVKRLDKNNDDQFFKWDLKNEKGLPVASGIYFAHIKMTLPDGSKVTKVLKIFIIQEAQILEFF